MVFPCHERLNYIYIHKWWSLSEYRQNKNVIGPSRTVTSTCICIQGFQTAEKYSIYWNTSMHYIEKNYNQIEIDSTFVFVVASEGI